MKRFITALMMISIMSVLVYGCGNKQTEEVTDTVVKSKENVEEENNSIEEEDSNIEEEDSNIEVIDITEEEVNNTENNKTIQVETVQEQLNKISKGIENYKNAEYVSEIQDYTMGDNSGSEIIEKIKGVGTSYKVYANAKLMVEAYKDDESAITYIRNYDKIYAVTNDELTKEEIEAIGNNPMTMERHFTKDELDELLVSDAVKTVENTLDTINTSDSLLDIAEDANTITMVVGDTPEDNIKLTIVFDGENIIEINSTYRIYDYNLSTSIKYENTEKFEIPEEIKANAIKVNDVSCFIMDVRYEESENNEEVIE